MYAHIAIKQKCDRTCFHRDISQLTDFLNSHQIQRLISRFARLGTIFYCQILLFYAKNANKHNFTEIEGEE